MKIKRMLSVLLSLAILWGGKAVFDPPRRIHANDTTGPDRLVVTTTSDVIDPGDGAISLREALAGAVSGDTITFKIPLTDSGYLSSGEDIGKWRISPNTTLESSASGITIDGGRSIILHGWNNNRVLRFTAGSGTIHLKGLSIISGVAYNPYDAMGGGVFFSSSADLSECYFFNNGASSGGAIYAAGHVTMNRCEFISNGANYGGAIYTDSGNIDAAGCIFRGNIASEYGGAIFTNQTNVKDSSFFGNQAKQGGAIYGRDSVVSGFYSTNTSFIENSTLETGSGAVDIPGYGYVFYSTFARNSGYGIRIASRGVSGSYAFSYNSIYGSNTGSSNNGASNVPLVGSNNEVNSSNSWFGDNIETFGYIMPRHSSTIKTTTAFASPSVAGLDGNGIWAAIQHDQMGNPRNPNSTGNVRGAVNRTARTINVSSTNNSGSNTLRNAIATANSEYTADIRVIRFMFSSPATITLTSMLPEIELGTMFYGSMLNATEPMTKITTTYAGSILYCDIGLGLIVRGLHFEGARLDAGELASFSTLTPRGASQIENCVFSNNKYRIGSAINVTSASAHSVIKKCVFLGNTAIEHGGAVAIGGFATITDCVFFSNVANDANQDDYYCGGAIASSSWYSRLNVLLNNCVFSGNNVKSGYGGAVGATRGSVIANGCIFTGNYATYNKTDSGTGGTIYIGEGTVEVNNCRFTDNTAHQRGGGIALINGSITSTNSIFTQNGAVNSATVGKGGAIYIQLGNLTVSNSDFLRNASKENGGAIYALEAPVSLSNSSFVGNTGVNGGGLYTDSGAFSATNTDFQSNTAQNDGGGVYARSAPVTMHTGSFTANTAVCGGGLSTNTGNITIDGITFDDNKASGSSSPLVLGKGGGIYSKESAIKATDCVFIGNEAIGGSDGIVDNGGGGIYVYRGSCLVIDSFFTGNEAPTGCAMRTERIPATAVNCVFTNNISNSDLQRYNGVIDCDSAVYLYQCTIVGNTGRAVTVYPVGQEDELYAYNCIIVDNTEGVGGIQEYGKPFIPYTKTDGGNSLIEGIADISRESVFGSNGMDTDGRIYPMIGGLADKTADKLTESDLTNVPSGITAAEIISILMKDYDRIPRNDMVNYGALDTSKNGISSVEILGVGTSYPYGTPLDAISGLHVTYDVGGSVDIALPDVGVTANNFADYQFASMSDFSLTVIYLGKTASKTIVRTKADSTATISPISVNSVYGQSALLSVEVTGVAGCAYPTGIVQLKLDGVDYLDPVALVDGVAQIEVGEQTVRDTPYALTAVYSGDGNYNGSTADAEWTVRKASQTALTIVGGNLTKTYGDANFTLMTDGGSGDGVVTWVSSHPDLVEVNPDTGEVVLKVATGGTSVTITATKAGGNDYNNTTAAITVTVDKKELTVTADSKSREYGAANPAFTISYKGFITGEDESNALDTVPVVSCAADETTSAGSVPITVGGGAAKNYSFKYVAGTLTITQIGQNPITIQQGASLSKTYGDSDFSLTTAGGSGTGAVLWSSSDDSIVSVDQTGRVSVKGASETAVTITVSKAGDDNYGASAAAMLITVSKKKLDVTTPDMQKYYGEVNPLFTVAYSGFVNHEDENVLTEKPTAATAATTTSIVGSYPIVLSGGVSDNYAFVYHNGTLIVNKSGDTAFKLNNGADIRKTYGDGAFVLGTSGAHGTITYESKDLTVAVIDANGELRIVAAGEVQIYAYDTGDDNYQPAVAAITLTVDKKAVTVTADHQQKYFGDADPMLTWEVEPALVVGDTLAGSLKYTGTAVGYYDIVEATAFHNDNYAISFVKGTMTIKQTLSMEEVIAKINALPNPIIDWEDADEVADVTNDYEHLSLEEKGQIPDNDKRKLLLAQEQSGPVNRKDRQLTVLTPTLPWYIRVIAIPIPETDTRYRAFFDKLTDKKLIVLYDIKLMNTLTGEKYELPTGMSVLVEIDGVNIGAEKNVAIAHENADGTLEIIPGVTDSGKVTFTATGFSLYGLTTESVADPIIKTGEKTDNAWLWMTLLVLSAIAFLERGRRKKKG